MKKLLGISIVAMLAVTPMMANAAGQVIPAVTNDADHFATIDDTVAAGNTQIATVNYVKGAYNAVQAELEQVADDIDVTTDGTHIHANKSVAENLAELDTAVTANDTKIGDIDTLMDTASTNAALWTNGAGQAQTHGDVVTAIQNTKTQVNAVDSRVGQLSGLDSSFTNNSSVVGALNELKTATSNTDNKVVAVYSKWNGGAKPLRNSTDYVGLRAVDSTLTGLDTANE